MRPYPVTLAGKRDRTLIAFGYDTLCRRSELVSLRAEALSVTSRGVAQILIRRSKNDPYGNGRLGYVSNGTFALLRGWPDAAKIDRGFIFRRVRSGKIGEKPLHPYSVNRVLKDVASRAGIPAEIVKELSGHSMRVGAAQDMIASGMGALPIMRAGGWRTMNVVARYVENTDLAAIMGNR
ncbi:tyrosine-type recombinase/integrase [Methylocystis sp. WRRC1]|uniref:tyrosine-type recombinase/integrase n=1 Tax=Methylocystis sp. WRRC1 TaxID=1732014 RepID=UPI001D157278|nr:tyrosine-type recombinase/integrase [Methylocystis sp. WRRC1]